MLHETVCEENDYFQSTKWRHKFKHLAVDYPVTQSVNQDHHSGVLTLGALLQLLSYSHSSPVTEVTSWGQRGSAEGTTRSDPSHFHCQVASDEMTGHHEGE